jgi:hypothetical protein
MASLGEPIELRGEVELRDTGSQRLDEHGPTEPGSAERLGNDLPDSRDVESLGMQRGTNDA